MEQNYIGNRGARRGPGRKPAKTEKRVTIRPDARQRAIIDMVAPGEPCVAVLRIIDEYAQLKAAVAPRGPLAAAGTLPKVTKTPADVAQELLPRWKLYARNWPAGPPRANALEWVTGAAKLAGPAARERAEKVLDVLQLLPGGSRP